MRLSSERPDEPLLKLIPAETRVPHHLWLPSDSGPSSMRQENEQGTTASSIRTEKTTQP